MLPFDQDSQLSAGVWTTHFFDSIAGIPVLSVSYFVYYGLALVVDASGAITRFLQYCDGAVW